MGKKIVDIQTGKNLLFSKKQQIYFLRDCNKKIYSIRRQALEEVVCLEIINMIEVCIEQYLTNKRKKDKEVLGKLQCDYAALIEDNFQGKIDEINFQKKENVLLKKIKEMEKQEQERDLTSEFLGYQELLKQWANKKLIDYKTMNGLLEKVQILERKNNNVTIKLSVNTTKY